VPESPTQTITAQPPVQSQIEMSDHSLVTLGAPKPNGTRQFDETGYMAVNQKTIAGLDIPDWVDGIFIHYDDSGVQAGDGSIEIHKLHLQLVGYKGAAHFGHDGAGKPTVSGILDQIVLAEGNLIEKSGPELVASADKISGQLSTVIRGKALRGASELDITVEHSASDMRPAPGGFTLDGGALHAIAVPLGMA